ncbi:hypothetical protein DUNSADRAFT_10376 [Dunaliella salina]|uniref:Uncharacterized protein n=1 Tax=Dunaliella salina TaxID=3046 RepID=A0ABQ7GFJ2_DUNSA|nr:hypothetical protein DUNSADRAFT_10376 [Dunaliella salina]|eukprot:KAF5833373.1 hypothetical protein DUNSADRAFT_10376 [Dunaliella salina]
MRRKRIKTDAEPRGAEEPDGTLPCTSGRGEKRVPRSGPALAEFQLPGSHRRLQRATTELFYGRHLSSLHENCLTWKNTDKCFAVAWVDHETALWGTKCNKLLLMNLRTKQITQLCQPPVPPTFPRPPVRNNLYGR